MKVYYSLGDFTPLENAVVTTGTFDGVHKGHRKILDRLAKVAQENNGESVLLTFFPHPRMVLQPELDLKLINSQLEKIALLKNCGLDHLIIHPFSKEFSRITSLDFVRTILVNTIGAKKLVIGYDHHFGRNREGSFEHLKESGPVYGFDVEEIPAEDIDNTTISSTKIRRAISDGDIKTANEYLGYVYGFSGKVVEGEKNGSKLGFPTANILVEEGYKMIPKDGAYAVQVEFPLENGKTFNGMCNIGLRPTFNGTFKTIEVHLFDFNKDIYGQRLNVKFIDRLRNERKFDSIDNLKDQLEKDAEASRNILGIF